VLPAWVGESRVTTIPEEAATEQVRKFTPLAAYLEKRWA
jgi:phosphonate transport system substrate-binding protein